MSLEEVYVMETTGMMLFSKEVLPWYVFIRGTAGWTFWLEGAVLYIIIITSLW